MARYTLKFTTDGTTPVTPGTSILLYGGDYNGAPGVAGSLTGGLLDDESSAIFDLNPDTLYQFTVGGGESPPSGYFWAGTPVTIPINLETAGTAAPPLGGFVPTPDAQWAYIPVSATVTGGLPTAASLGTPHGSGFLSDAVWDVTTGHMLFTIPSQFVGYEIQASIEGSISVSAAAATGTIAPNMVSDAGAEQGFFPPGNIYPCVATQAASAPATPAKFYLEAITTGEQADAWLAIDDGGAGALEGQACNLVIAVGLQAIVS